MKIVLSRFTNLHNKSTMGLLFIDGEFQCYTLENPFRFAKMPGDSRIPEGEYKVQKRKVLSPMTKRYRDQFPYFDYHLELQDVPEFQFIYFHIGNTAPNTDGCVLVGETSDFVREFVGRSGPAFEKMYKKISAALEAGQEVTCTIQAIRP